MRLKYVKLSTFAALKNAIMNDTIERMTSFIVMDVLERANELQREGIDVIHLEVGEPDFNMPECIAQAAIDAHKNGATHYTHSLGDPQLR